jgi:serine-type D-Ala-D-Ala endopeptidase (penicillin-binding protein 7)
VFKRNFFVSLVALAAAAFGLGLFAPAADAAARKAASAKTVKAATKAKGHTAARAAKATPARGARKFVVVTARGRKVVTVRQRVAVAPSPIRRAIWREDVSRVSVGQTYGLHLTPDPLELKSNAALVIDQDTSEVLVNKNSQAVLPIASLTKLMTALVVVEAGLPLDEAIGIDEMDIDTEKGSHSRLAVGTELTREQMLHLALMSSENRAAHALGRHYPGGLSAFVTAMNRKAAQLGMSDTRYVEPTGLSSQNRSSARDLATLVRAASQHQLIRELSTSPEHEVAIGERFLNFRNTNSLVKNPAWEIGLQKTGYISEAGRCLVMQTHLVGRKIIMVFLDSAGKYSRLGDAERVRRWLEDSQGERIERVNADGERVHSSAPQGPTS